MWEQRVRRWRFLRATGVASIGADTGCLSDEGDPEPATPSGGEEEEAAESDDAEGAEDADDPRQAETNGVAVHRREYFAETADLFEEDHPYEEYRPDRPD